MSHILKNSTLILSNHYSALTPVVPSLLVPKPKGCVSSSTWKPCDILNSPPRPLAYIYSSLSFLPHPTTRSPHSLTLGLVLPLPSSQALMACLWASAHILALPPPSLTPLLPLLYSRNTFLVTPLLFSHLQRLLIRASNSDLPGLTIHGCPPPGHLQLLTLHSIAQMFTVAIHISSVTCGLLPLCIPLLEMPFLPNGFPLQRPSLSPLCTFAQKAFDQKQPHAVL